MSLCDHKYEEFYPELKHDLLSQNNNNISILNQYDDSNKKLLYSHSSQSDILFYFCTLCGIIKSTKSSNSENSINNQSIKNNEVKFLIDKNNHNHSYVSNNLITPICFINNPFNTLKAITNATSLLPFNISYDTICEEVQIYKIISSNILYKDYPEFYKENRNKLVNYLLELVNEFEYSMKVFHQALYILDYFYKYVSKQVSNDVLIKENHNTIVIACFLISNDAVCPLTTSFEDKQDPQNVYDSDEIIKNELCILNIFAFRLDFFSSFNILHSSILMGVLYEKELKQYFNKLNIIKNRKFTQNIHLKGSPFKVKRRANKSQSISYHNLNNKLHFIKEKINNTSAKKTKQKFSSKDCLLKIKSSTFEDIDGMQDFDDMHITNNLELNEKKPKLMDEVFTPYKYNKESSKPPINIKKDFVKHESFFNKKSTSNNSKSNENNNKDNNFTLNSTNYNKVIDENDFESEISGSDLDTNNDQIQFGLFTPQLSLNNTDKEFLKSFYDFLQELLFRLSFEDIFIKYSQSDIVFCILAVAKKLYFNLEMKVLDTSSLLKLTRKKKSQLNLLNCSSNTSGLVIDKTNSHPNVNVKMNFISQNLSGLSKKNNSELFSKVDTESERLIDIIWENSNCLYQFIFNFSLNINCCEQIMNFYLENKHSYFKEFVMYIESENTVFSF